MTDIFEPSDGRILTDRDEVCEALRKISIQWRDLRLAAYYATGVCPVVSDTGAVTDMRFTGASGFVCLAYKDGSRIERQPNWSKVQFAAKRILTAGRIVLQESQERDGSPSTFSNHNAVEFIEQLSQAIKEHDHVAHMGVGTLMVAHGGGPNKDKVVGASETGAYALAVAMQMKNATAAPIWGHVPLSIDIALRQSGQTQKILY